MSIPLYVEPPPQCQVQLLNDARPLLCQSHTGSESSSNSRKEMLPKPITIVTSESSSTCFVRSEEFSFGSGHAVTTQTPAQVAVLTPSGPLYPCVTSANKLLAMKS